MNAIAINTYGSILPISMLQMAGFKHAHAKIYGWCGRT